MHLLELPHEILHELLVRCVPLDLPSLQTSCRTLRNYIKGNHILHKELYLLKWDPPTADKEVDWERGLTRSSHLQTLLDSDSLQDKRKHLPSAARVIFYLLRNASTRSDQASKNLEYLKLCFGSRSNLEAFLCSSSLFGQDDDRATARSRRRSESQDVSVMQQHSAKLHVLFGVPTEPESREENPVHPYARSRVYNLRQYTPMNRWGPFQDDGSDMVDWEKMEAIMVDLGYNMRVFRHRTFNRTPLMWDKPWEGATPNSFVNNPPDSPPPQKAAKRELSGKLGLKDPYGIAGIWMRVVCFLDYSDFFSYNFGVLANHDKSLPTPPINHHEAIRLIRMELHVTKIESAPSSENQDLPVVWFEGTARSMHAGWDPNANSRIRGKVRLTPEGEVHWTSWSVFHGEERWRSECIQVGGPRSARGAIGTWFDKDFEPEGPAGPTAYWKIADEVDDDQSHHSQLLAAQYSGLDSSDGDDVVHEDDDSEDDEDFDPNTSNMVFLTSSD